MSQGKPVPSHLIDNVMAAVVVDADNVQEYFRLHLEKEWTYAELPPCRLPHPAMLIEANCVCDNAISRVGVYMLESTAEAALGLVAQAGSVPSWFDKTKHAIFFTTLIKLKQRISTQSVVHVVSGGFMPLDENWVPVYAPVVTSNLEFKQALGDNYEGYMFELDFFAFLSVAFMNCKNVKTASHDPSPTVNRERKKAKLRPFVRYHTINIEPMKSVLRTEGGIERNGLRKAVHICRGHFAHYAKSFMGRPLEKPITVWRPAHVRGCADEGLIISDYKVNPPQGEKDETHGKQ